MLPAHEDARRELLARGRRVLARASVVAEASAGRLERQGGRSARESRQPQMAGRPFADAVREMLRHARTWEELGERVEVAEQMLERVQKAPPSDPETPAQFRARLVQEHRGRSAIMVAKIERVSLTYVRNIRSEAGVDPAYGWGPRGRTAGTSSGATS